LIRAGDATFTFTERIRAFSTAAIPEPFGEHQRATRSVPVIVEYGRWAEQSTEGWVDTDWLVVGARLRTLEPTRLRILEHGDEATVTLTTGSEFIVHDEDRCTFGLPDSPDGSVPEDYGVPEEAGPAPQASLHRDGFELTERAHTQQRHFDLALRPGGRGPRLLDGAEHLVVPKSGREF